MNFAGRLQTSLTIIRHSLVVLFRHPQLLWFVAFELVLGFLAYRFFFGPVFESSAEAWRSAGTSREGWGGSPAAYFPYGKLALAYLPGMFLATFFNVALYSQILQALNGGRVSLVRGLALAWEKLPAIVAWSLVAGTVGMLLRLLQDRTGPVGKWIAALAGFSWSAASAFVVPVIINEPDRRRPTEYLKISAALLKRVWGEGAIAFVGIGLLGVLVALVMVAIGSATVAISGQQLMLIYSMLIISYVIFALLYMIWRVFECGLYIYASEGVAPGTFDEELFQRAWVVGSGAGPAGSHVAAQRPALPRKLLIAVVAIVAACVAVIWLSQPQRRVPLQHAGPEVGVIAIDLAGLGYELQYAQLQAVGLFPDRKREGCEFPPEPAREMLHERVAGQVTATMARQGRFLYIHFFGADAQPVEQRIGAVRDALRAKYPAHTSAINSVSHVSYVPLTTVAEWEPSRGAATYSLELDCLHCCRENRWCADIGRTMRVEQGLTSTRYSFEWGAQPGRWRVWPVDAEGRAGPKSGWTGFDYSYSPCGQPG